MVVNNPPTFAYIKEASGDILRPDVLTLAEMISSAKAALPVAWKQDSDSKFASAAWMHTLSGDVILPKIVDIGDWNMDTTATLNVAHGVASKDDILYVNGWIRDNINDHHYRIPTIYSPNSYDRVQVDASQWDDTYVYLSRYTGGYFDDPFFSLTPYNRGQLFIWIIY